MPATVCWVDPLHAHTPHVGRTMLRDSNIDLRPEVGVIIERSTGGRCRRVGQLCNGRAGGRPVRSQPGGSNGYGAASGAVESFQACSIRTVQMW
jgi:hypothetical protein